MMRMDNLAAIFSTVRSHLKVNLKAHAVKLQKLVATDVPEIRPSVCGSVAELTQIGRG
jgi:hypothetical protein